MISDSLRQNIRDLLGQHIENIQSVSGGSINQAAKITTADEQEFFLKWNNSAPKDMFAKEQKGLELLAQTDSGLQLPVVIGVGSTDAGTDFILMTFIIEGNPHSDAHVAFGRQLAALHKNTADQYGLDHHNYIGKLPQSNTRHQKWADFFINERLQPQLRMAVDGGKLSSAISGNFKKLYKQLPNMLTDEPPGLLHGDLWGGNYFFDADGEPAIYDPAVYYGNREIELAFTHLFGGFSTTFYDAYNEAWPLQPSFANRKDIYNLYPLLVHTNLFGGSYARQVENIVQRFA
jgi:fructosamine-3-kinase